MSLLGKIARIVAPVAATYFGTPVAGAFVSKAIGGYDQLRAQRASFGGGPAPVGPGGGGINGYGGDGGMMRTGAAGASGTWGVMKGWVVGARGVVRNAYGRIVGVMQGTKLLRNPVVMRVVRQLGMVGAIAALGILAAEMAEIVIGETSKRRRRVRGITGRDIKCTRRTLGKIRSVQRMIGVPTARRSSSRGRPAGGTVVCN